MKPQKRGFKGLFPSIPRDRIQRAMEEYERTIHAHIKEHGCSVTSVFDPDGSEPTFTYSRGIAKTALVGARHPLLAGNSEP